ncbi:hypothetical protein OIU77_021503 [Salix suchowensis]|uniref:Uncharacterized protein n=1 Tax=Salix suchowensis TaxID=1278906 RepID=A0ABQ9CDZ0_9ROSI|nr:hypothetical protein OIU77_021503 [Salix suchowensis]
MMPPEIQSRSFRPYIAASISSPSFTSSSFPFHLSLPPNQNPIIILTSFPLLLPLLDLVSLLLFSLTTLASPSLSLLAPFSSLTWVALPSLQP